LSLRQLADDTSIHLEAIENLDDENHKLQDRLLIHLMCSKLDNGTKREWERHIINKKCPPVDMLVQFLIERAKLLEKTNVNKSVKNPNINCMVSTKNLVCPSCKGSHLLYHCEQFLNSSINNRISSVKKLNLCLNCLKANHYTNNCKWSGCRKCHKKHNTLLHLDQKSNDEPEAKITQSPRESNNSDQNLNSNIVSNHSCTNTISSQILLATVCLQVRDKSGQFRNCRALLDSGSQCNLISNGCCKKLGLKLTKINSAIIGINQCKSQVQYKTDINIISNYMQFETQISCLVMGKVTENLPSSGFDPVHLNIPENIQLADPLFNQKSEIDLLLGSDIFWNLLCIGQIKLGKNKPTLQKTKFGWIISGPIPNYSNIHNNTFLSNINIHEKIHNEISKFWEIEDCQNHKPALSEEETLCENHFIATTKRHESGKLIVSIPFKSNVSELGESHSSSLKRFYALERKLEKNAPLKKQYHAFMTEYELLGHMSEVKVDNRDGYYLPHHPVFKEDSTTTKLRVVFDGSAKTSSGLSLNDVQMVGPPLQNDLFNILLRFRQHQFVIKADIEKMYRQVLIEDNQKQYQKIFWRSDLSQPVKVYKLNTVTYGTSSAPFLAIRSLNQVALDHFQNDPVISNIINNDFYVDDLLTGAETIDSVVQIRNKLTAVLATVGFNLRKWTSNSDKILTNTSESTSTQIPFLSDGFQSKTLGIQWNHSRDLIQYTIKENSNKKFTKRTILSEISQIFDPLGLVGPCITVAKLVLQEIWQLKLNWDESIPADIHTQWVQFKKDLINLNKIVIPRHVICNQPKIVEVHGFCDASERAYGACIYLKSITESGDIGIQLLCAKSRVAPLKTISIPRLELCGAVLLAQLSKRVKDSLTINIDREIYWSDSTITLAWIAGSPNRWKQFVSNRVAEIQRLTNHATWRHVPTSDNPADIISRGLNPSQLQKSELWLNGPQFLQTSEQYWPTSLTTMNDQNVPEQKSTTISLAIQTIDNEFNLIFKFSTYNKLKRVTAYLRRFINNCKSKKDQRIIGPLVPAELANSETTIIKIIQNTEFNREIQELVRNKQIHKSSNLLSLNPFLDKDNILRVGGRIRHSNVNLDQKHPIVIPGSHHVTKLIIEQEHKRLMHAGTGATLSAIWCKYWPVSGRNSVQQVLRRCISCYRTNPKAMTPVMGNLPACRLQPCRPFIKSGVDYAGPFIIKEGVYKRKRLLKAYIALFVCMTTKAVHIELVSDLTTDAFLATLKRFIARRGIVTDLFSDNGTNFVGANNELHNLEQLFKIQINGEKIVNTLANDQITWHFIPPRAPHFGGLWEASVKSLKNHLKRVIGDAHLTFEAFSTVLTQIEAILNSRPLTPMSNDPNDLSCLTAGHFLIGDSMTSFPHPDLQEVPSNRLTQWQRIEQLRQHFWTRWSKEYISLLQQRSKWKSPQANVELGQLVLIKEDNLPPLRWVTGRIVQLFPGQDKITRVVLIKTSSGLIKRSVSRVCVLPIDTSA
jgi:hypothetical protein